MVDGNCTNKNCIYRNSSKAVSGPTNKSKKAETAKKETKSSRTRRASKCITYNLKDLEKKENIN